MGTKGMSSTRPTKHSKLGDGGEIIGNVKAGRRMKKINRGPGLVCSVALVLSGKICVILSIFIHVFILKWRKPGVGPIFFNSF